MDVICVDKFANLRLLWNRVIIGLVGMNLHNAWLWQMNSLWCKLMFLLLNLCILQTSFLNAYIIKTLYFRWWTFVCGFYTHDLWHLCDVIITTIFWSGWLVVFNQIKYLGIIDEKDSFGYIMRAFYISWNCNNDYNGVPFIYLGKGMFCQDWHLALGTWLGLVEVCFGWVVELVWNV
jgi:hypothetical protein